MMQTLEYISDHPEMVLSFILLLVSFFVGRIFAKRLEGRYKNLAAGLDERERPEKKSSEDDTSIHKTKPSQTRVREILDQEHNLIFIVCLNRSVLHRRNAYSLLFISVFMLFAGISLLYYNSSQAEPQNQVLDWAHVFLASIPRIGMVVLLIFIVQVLLRLYRYHLKMSDFYSSRYDAILLAERIKDKPAVDAATYAKAIAMVSPPYDVGKDIRAPWDEAFSKAKAIKDIAQ